MYFTLAPTLATSDSESWRQHVLHPIRIRAPAISDARTCKLFLHVVGVSLQRTFLELSPPLIFTPLERHHCRGFWGVHALHDPNLATEFKLAHTQAGEIMSGYEKTQNGVFCIQILRMIWDGELVNGLHLNGASFHSFN